MRPSRLHPFLAWWRGHPICTFLLASSCWVALLYWPVIRAGFVYDDRIAIQQNPALSSWSSIATYFRSPVPLSSDFRGYAGSIYRPLVWLGFTVERHLWGVTPTGFHLTNLAIHWASGILGYLLLRRLRVSLLMSAVAALVWLGMPVNSEAVAWISGRHTCQPVLFLLASLLFALVYARNRNHLLLAGYALTFLATVFSNEWGLLALPLTICALLFDRPQPRRVCLSLCGTGIAASGLYLVLRGAAGAHLPLGAITLLPAGISFFKYLAWIVLPIRMNIERSSDTPANSLSVASASALAALVLLAGCVFDFRRRIPKIAAGLLWTSIALLPFLGIVFVYQGMAERYAYLASAGMGFAIVALAFRSYGRLRALVTVAVFVWVAWGAWRLHHRVLEWTSEVALYQASLEATPRSPVLLYNLGVALSQSGRTAEAASCYRRAVDLKPDYAPALINLASLLTGQGDYPQAELLLHRAISSDPKSPDAWIDLGNLYLQSGSIDDARRAYRQALSLDPRNLEATLNSGAALQRSGDLKGAAAEYRRAIELDPRAPAPYCNLGSVLLQQGDSRGAMDLLTKAIALDPAYPVAYFDLGALYERAANPDLAIRMYKKALELNPAYTNASLRLQALESK